MFAPRISIFLANMLEVNDIMTMYKSACCKMPCYSCKVMQEHLSNMNLSPEDTIPRIPTEMQNIISDRLVKNFLIHSIQNAFWTFLQVFSNLYCDVFQYIKLC